MYKFVKLKDTRLKNHILDWRLEISNVSELLEFEEKYVKSVLEKSFMDDLYNIEKKTAHGKKVEEYAKITGKQFTGALLDLDAKGCIARFNRLLQFRKIYVNQRGAFCVPVDSLEPEEECEKENMVFPQYSVKDIKIHKYLYGNHHYPKIGNMDVVHNGIVKWNTAERAYEVAKMYL